MEQETPTGLVVDELWRFPVKSMGGERLPDVAVDALGMEGDRRWGIVDVGTGRVLTARRAPALLMAQARHLGPGEVAITLPDGTATTSDDDLSEWLGRRVALVASSTSDGEPGDAPAFEVPNPDEEDWQAYGVAEGGARHERQAGPGRVVPCPLGDWDPRRFRSNVLLRGAGEDELVGATLALGTATLEISKPVGRCVMVTRPQPGLAADRSVLRTILRDRDGTFAIGALVTASGTLAEGDPLRLLAPPGG